MEDAPVQGYSRQAEQAVHSVDVPMGLSEKSVQDSRIPDMKLVPLTNGALESFRIPMDKASFTIGRIRRPIIVLPRHKSVVCMSGCSAVRMDCISRIRTLPMERISIRSVSRR